MSWPGREAGESKAPFLHLLSGLQWEGDACDGNGPAPSRGSPYIYCRTPPPRCTQQLVPPSILYTQTDSQYITSQYSRIKTITGRCPSLPNKHCVLLTNRDIPSSTLLFAHTLKATSKVIQERRSDYYTALFDGFTISLSLYHI